MKQEFKYIFQIDKSTVFNIEYYTLGNNKSPRYTTSASVFNRPKTDYNRCGQCQKDVLTGKALEFYLKYDNLHLKDLTDAEYEAILKDIEELKTIYNYEECNPQIKYDFEICKRISKLNIKKGN